MSLEYRVYKGNTIRLESLHNRAWICSARKKGDSAFTQISMDDDKYKCLSMAERKIDIIWG